MLVASLGFGQTPQVSSVVNAATFQTGAAPGALISIFGTNLATGNAEAQVVPLPINLGGTTVYIDGMAAPLLYVSASQINAQLPYEIPANSSATVAVQVNQVTGPNATFAVSSAAPGIFTLSGNGLGSGAILNMNYSVVMDNNPVQPGQVVQIYATGLGVTPGVSTGTAASGPSAVQGVTVTIGGQNAVVGYAGAAPGFVGVDQLNVTVPNVASGAQPVVISIGGVQSAANVTIAVGDSTPSPGMIAPTFFGMELSSPYFTGAEPWPAIPFTTVRLNADDLTWADLQPSAGVFDFTLLDQVLDGASAHGLTPADLIYTMTKTPTWASSNPAGTGCADYLKRTGGCFAPYDVNADGTGTDALWQAYVTALVQHVCPTPDTCRIQYWEGWNEPNNPNDWQSTTAQLVRMQQDAYKIIKGISPNLVVVSPSVAPGGGSIENGIKWMTGFLTAGGGSYFDIMGFHGYLNAGAAPEGIATMVSNWTSLLASEGLSKMPLWDTEGSWGEQTNLPDPDQQTAYLPRYFLLQSAAVQRFYWYSYNDNYGTLETNNQLTQAGMAYGHVYNWLVGATVASACSNKSGSIWTCAYTRPGGYQALAVWDASQACGDGVCTTSGYTAPAGYVQYRDLVGNVTAITAGAQIQVGLKPILLENQNP
jgi:uncharacterized protein (TIGR03437 family)